MDLDDEELKATRRMNCSDKDVGSMEKDIKILEKMLKTRKEQKEIIECAGGYCGNCNPDIKALENAIQTMKAYKELKEENKELISDNLDYQRTLDIFDKRTYRKKYLEERRKEEPNLLYPDADEIYKRYYKLREENKELKKDNKRYEKELHDVIEFSIPVSLVEEKRTKLKEQYNKVVNEINNQGMIDQLIDFKEVSAKLEMCEELLEKRK